MAMAGWTSSFPGQNGNAKDRHLLRNNPNLTFRRAGRSLRTVNRLFGNFMDGVFVG